MASAPFEVNGNSSVEPHEELLFEASISGSTTGVEVYHADEISHINQLILVSVDGDRMSSDGENVTSDEEMVDAGEDKNSWQDDGDLEYSDDDDDADDDDDGNGRIEDDEDDGWTLGEPRRHEDPIVFRGIEHISVPINISSPFDFFQLLFSSQILENIVGATNACAVEVLAHSSGDNSRISRWKDVDVPEFLIFLGILFQMGTIKLNRYSDYWRKHYLFNLYAGKYMSRNRFLLIISCLRFGTNNLTSLIDYFNNIVRKYYKPGKNLSIDESMILYRGRSGIRQYIKGKRHQHGIKLYILATPCGISLQIHMYQGKRDIEVGGQGHTEKVVLKLLGHYLNNGHSVYMDNFYNSVSLARTLLDQKTNVTGTLRAKRKGNPSVVVNSKLRKGGSIYRYHHTGIAVCKWRDQRDVLTISTEHSPELKEVTNKRGFDVLKPEIVLEYNKFMSGVDKQDQMLSYYSCEHKSMRWYKKVGIHIFQMLLLNSFYLYKKCHRITAAGIDYYTFRQEIITKLLPPPPPITRLPTNAHKKVHLPMHLPKDNKGNTKRRRCKRCWDTHKLRKNTLFYCNMCPSEPGLCLECFRRFHKY